MKSFLVEDIGPYILTINIVAAADQAAWVTRSSTATVLT